MGTLHAMTAINPQAKGIAYILYPMEILREWIEPAASRYGVSITVISNMDWDNDLTPWPAPGQPMGCPDFKGLATEFLKKLTGEVLPAIDNRYRLPDDIERSLVGVSLSGLFALWQWSLGNTFRNIATLSGSYWYEGFEQWIFRQSFADKTGRCYMLLGDEEPHSSVPAFRRVGTCTENIVGYLRRQGVDIKYDVVPGNHFQYALPRLNKAFENLFPTKTEDEGR